MYYRNISNEADRIRYDLFMNKSLNAIIRFVNIQMYLGLTIYNELKKPYQFWNITRNSTYISKNGQQ
jgi:hypothetical protein